MITVTRPALPPLERYAEYLQKIWANHWLTNDGELVHQLGKQLEEYLDAKNLVLVSNGTQALELALRALNLKGEVITTPFTFSATTNVLLWLGLTPTFADIDPETYNLDPAAVEAKITEKTSAILAVHVYGNPCDVEALEEIAQSHHLKLIYDAAHAFAVQYHHQSILHYGDISTMSYHATKVFNTIEGGAIITKNSTTFEKLKLMRNHGIKSEEEVILPGTNAKMNEFQAAMGLCNLRDIDEMILVRRGLYGRYLGGLGGVGGLGFQRLVGSRYNFAYVPVCFQSKLERDRVYAGLLRVGVRARKYFYPLTCDFGYFGRRRRAGLVNARWVADRVLCLPLYPDLELGEVDMIVERIREILGR